MSDHQSDENQKRQPQFFTSRGGTRLYSLHALLERIITAFLDEYGEESPALREANTPAKRLRLLLDVANYVIAVESISISDDEKADVLRQAYSDLFGYGPLDDYLKDENVTTIALNGIDHAAVRYGHGDLQTIPPLFHDSEQLRRVIARLITEAGAEMRDDTPAIEIGLLLDGRPLSISLFAPSLAFGMNVDIRLHPRQAPSLDDLVAQEWMTDEAADLLRSIVRSNFGFVVVGEPETGKTTLMSALARELPDDTHAVSVERAGEMRLPPDFEQLTVKWAVGAEGGVPLSMQIEHALTKQPRVLLLDEVRSDEPSAVAPLLASDDAPRQLWVMRGAPDHKRLQSALGMLARRADMTQGEALVHALYERLPFMITLARVRGQLKLFSVAEWQSRADNDYPDLIMLRRFENGMARPTGSPSARWL